MKNELNICKLIAMSAHAGQFRRDGTTPYINHVEAVARRVAERGHGEDKQMVAWLHDILEDTDVSETDLLWQGVPRDVIEAVVILSCHGDYEKYLERVMENDLARAVKIADMLSNLADSPTEKQIIKYSRGLLYLLDV